MTETSRGLVELLRALQDLDGRIAALDREIADGPSAVESHRRALAAADAKIATLEERQKLLKAQVKLRENEAKTAQARVDRLQDQASLVKTNKEFTAIRSEIAFAKADVTRVEEEILKILEALELGDAAIATAGEERTRLKAKYDGERAKVDAAIDGLRAQRDELAKERPARLDGIPPEPLDAYERVRRARGNAVVPIVEGDYCSGCMERLTRNDVFAAMNASRLVVCKSCSRILFVN